MTLEILAQEKVWLNKSYYADAERVYFEKQTKILKNETFGKNKNDQVKSRNNTNCEDCSMCNILTQIDLHNDIGKLLDKVEQWDKIDSTMNLNQYKQINKFECLVCSFKTFKFSDWKCHIMSLPHMAACHKIKNLYSYVCCEKICKLLLYGPKELLIKHNMDKHSYNSDAFSMSTLMAEVMKRHLADNLKPLYFCSHCKKFAETPIHTDVKLLNNAIKIPIEYYCRFCRVIFLSSHEMIDYHLLSLEHTTLKCFDELCSEAKINSKKKKLSEESNQNNENNLSEDVQNVLTNNSVKFPNIILTRFLNISQYRGLCKLCGASLNWNSEIIVSHLLECPINLDVDERTVLDNNQTVQQSLVNNNILEKLNDDVQKGSNKSNENRKLMTPNHIKQWQQYTNYFKHKMSLLKKLRQYENLVMTTLSYYCDVCDFIAVEKYDWEKHNQTEHPVDNNRPITYCSTCFMFVVGGEHNRTIEHSTLLNFLQSLKPVEVLMEKTSLVKLVKSCSSDKNCINLEPKEKIGLNNTDCFKESKYSKDNDSKNSDCFLMKEPNKSREDPMMKNTVLLLDKIESQHEHEKDKTNSSNAAKLIHSEITSSNNLVNTLMTIPHQSNVLEEKMTENINLVNVSTDDLIFNEVENDSELIEIVKSQNKVISNFDETILPPKTNKTQIFEIKKLCELDGDQLYGEYVVQRLKNIQSTTIKQNVKLEIDYIFYTKMKQLSQENTES
ncbi:uncharacterized protein LOC100167121 isoform X3 [Acyrthosiphon pisum]|uniref:Uncharacterized protein n=1 Tax=Acyrthosiphon pisum TaxID=7029 RepID=A0A8R2D2Z2_ACYPI|nr:uncharacterized protein LOC100167121 isoform X3 [Acyrthosiphon pisum]|eukprot:XP_016658834.1 PREDICTED: uncharacterized protein LOC100167121 isoform X3 [Acyrthosiphon pisum]